MTGPLAGLRILDLTTVQMGPWCTRILADFGADVIKVEAPEGDSNRYTGVPRHRGMSGTFQHNARGKRSIAMDLKQPAAREALLRLVPTVEAFVSNIRPQALARLGLGYEAVKQANPSIVYLSMVGYGTRVTIFSAAPGPMATATTQYGLLSSARRRWSSCYRPTSGPT